RDGRDKTIPMRDPRRVGIGPSGKRGQLHVQAVLRAFFKEVWQPHVIVGMLARHQSADWLALRAVPVGAHVEVGPHTKQVEAGVSALPQNRYDVLAVQEAIEQVEIRGLDAGPPRTRVLPEPSALGD